MKAIIKGDSDFSMYSIQWMNDADFLKCFLFKNILKHFFIFNINILKSLKILKINSKHISKQYFMELPCRVLGRVCFNRSFGIAL